MWGLLGVVIGRQHWLLVDISCDKVLPLLELVGRGKEIAPRGCCGLQGGKWGWSTIEGSALGSLPRTLSLPSISNPKGRSRASGLWNGSTSHSPKYEILRCFSRYQLANSLPIILAVYFERIGGNLFVGYLWPAEWVKWWTGVKRVVRTSTVKCLTSTIDLPMDSIIHQ